MNTITNLVEIVRRHEVTAKDKDGIKLDQPTPEGLARAYAEGVHLKEQFPGYQFVGRHSHMNRTYMAALATLWGAGAATAQHSGVSYDPLLDSPTLQLPKDQMVALRNLGDDEAQIRLLFSDAYRPSLVTSGKALAGNLVEEARHHIDAKFMPIVRLYVTHEPTVEPTYLALLGLPLKFESMEFYTHEAEGFRLVAHHGSPLVTVERMILPAQEQLPEIKHIGEYHIDDLAHNVEKAV